MAVLTRRALLGGAAITAEEVQRMAEMRMKNFILAGLSMRVKRLLLEIS